MKRRFFMVVLLSCLGHITPTYGATVFSQAAPPDPSAAFNSDVSSGGQKIADNFALAGSEAITVRSIRFIGGFGNTAPPPSTPGLDSLPSDAIRVIFFEDAAGLPGEPLNGGDFTLANVVSRVPTGGPLLNSVYEPIEYGVNLGDGIALEPSTAYWVSITNEPSDSFFWVWARANGVVFDSKLASTMDSVTAGNWVAGGSGGGMWFELNDHNIPEPSTLTLLLISVFASAGCGGRS